MVDNGAGKSPERSLKRWRPSATKLLAVSIAFVSVLQIRLGWKALNDAQRQRSGAAGSSFVGLSRRISRAPLPRRVAIGSNLNDITILPRDIAINQSFVARLIQLLTGGSIWRTQTFSSLPYNPPLITPDWYEPNAKEQFVDEGYDLNVCEPMHSGNYRVILIVTLSMNWTC